MRFDATDGVELAGLLYEPKRTTTRAVVWLHGTGGASVFESRRSNLLAASFNEAGIAYFTFNNRGAHLVRRLKGRNGKSVDGGMAHEVIRECVFDIDGAARELRRRGFRELTLIGHSTGANKIAVYELRKPRNPYKRYVLLAGGDDTGMIYDALGDRRFRAALVKAKAMIKARRGSELVPKSISGDLMSWRAWYDMANPDGDYNVFPFLEVMRGVRLSRRPRFRHFKALRRPSLVLYGANDQYCWGDVPRCVSMLADVAPPNVELAVIADADHGFGGKEEELASVMIGWMGALRAGL